MNRFMPRKNLLRTYLECGFLCRQREQLQLPDERTLGVPLDRFRTTVFELDALPPEEPSRILTDALDSVIDVEAELEREKSDSAFLDGVRRTRLRNAQVRPVGRRISRLI